MPTSGKTTATRRTRTATPAEEVPAPRKETVSQLRNRLRNEAERKVINNHKDEFVKIATDLFAEHGMEFNRRLSEKEKAAKSIEDQLNMFPELRALFTRRAEEQAPPLSDVEWHQQQEAQRQVAAADGVEFREGE